MNLDAGQTFNFLPIPTDVHFGCGSSRSLPKLVRSLEARRVFIVTDPGVRRCGIVNNVTTILQHAAIDFTIYDQVTADFIAFLDRVITLQREGYGGNPDYRFIDKALMVLGVEEFRRKVESHKPSEET